MVSINLLNLENGLTFTKTFESSFDARKFVSKVRRGRRLMILAIICDTPSENEDMAH